MKCMIKKASPPVPLVNMLWVAYTMGLLLLVPVALSLNFKDMTFAEMREATTELQGSFAEVTEASKLLHVPVVSWTDGSKPAECSPPIARITNLQTLHTDEERPQVLISGEIHGNERVGPLAAFYTAHMLTLAAECVGISRIYQAGSGAGRGAGTSSVAMTETQAKACGLLETVYSISTGGTQGQGGSEGSEQLVWLAMLAAKRDTFVLPAANCHGYWRSSREDVNVDTNRYVYVP